MESFRRRRSLIGSVAMMLLSTGCGIHSQNSIVPADSPRELARQSLPEYVIAPPDILKIDALQAIPLPPYKIQSLDVLAIRASKTLMDEPIQGLYTVEPDGTINFGLTYGSVKLSGLTLEEAKKAIEKKLLTILKETQVDLTVAQGRGVQQIRGEHLVRPDGTVGLGSYGSVRVVGLTLSNAKLAIETHLKKYLQDPEVVVDVLAYNSQVYYVIFDQGGAGQRIFRLPITGNETVLDAVSQVTGLSPVSDEKKIWLARPSAGEENDEVLPVDWHAITSRGRAETNYQMMPGDRLFVKADSLVAVDTKLSRLLSPVERLFGITLLGTSTIKSVKFINSPTGQ